MAMDFGKNNRSVAFNPTSAFPLDARSYFESYEAARLAAATAEEAGSTNSIYYYGQTLVVVENKKATLYIIQPDNTLTPIGETAENSSIKIDENQFDFDQNGQLTLLGFGEEAKGKMLIAGADGKLAWATPIDTYTKSEIEEKIAAASHLKRTIVKKKEDIDVDANDADVYIYMVPTGLAEDDDKYDEYIVIEGAIEKVGSWEINLSDYAKKAELEAYVLNSDSRLMTDEEKTKLANLNVNAEENYIKDTSTDFEVNDDGVLSLKILSQNKVSGLSEALANKYDRSEGQLLSATDKAKLDALQLDGDDLAISGTISATQITDLKDWLSDNASDTRGLSENNFTNALYEKLVKIKNITSVSEQLNIDSSGTLSIVKINSNQVSDLAGLLNDKVSQSDLASLNLSVTSIANTLNALKPTVTQNATDIAALQEQLKWKNLID